MPHDTEFEDINGMASKIGSREYNGIEVEPDTETESLGDVLECWRICKVREGEVACSNLGRDMCGMFFKIFLSNRMCRCSSMMGVYKV